MDIVAFAENLRKLREKTGISQDRLAKEAGLSVSAVAKYETGSIKDVSLTAATKLSKVLARHLGKTDNTVLLLLNQSKNAADSNG